MLSVLVALVAAAPIVATPEQRPFPKIPIFVLIALFFLLRYLWRSHRAWIRGESAIDRWSAERDAARPKTFEELVAESEDWVRRAEELVEIEPGAASKCLEEQISLHRREPIASFLKRDKSTYSDDEQKIYRAMRKVGERGLALANRIREKIERGKT